MKNPTPRQIALLCSAAMALVSALLVFVFEPDPFQPIITFLIIIISGYFIILFMLEKFIYRKIKIIFKNIHQQKTATDEDRKIKDMVKSDPISDIDHEVAQWAKNNKEEIEHLKKLATFRKEFVHNVSHELKTPIFNIQGYLETLLDGGMEDEKIKYRFLEKAAQNVERLSALVNELEIISQLETGSLVLEKQSFNIYLLVKEVYDALEMKARQKNINIIFKKGSSQGIVHADKDKIRQVLLNLIENSVKYGKIGGTTTTSFYDMDEHILIEITDDGPGIEKEHLPRLFERFYRVDKHRSREEGGSGLGLAIVKHLLEAHGQTIHVRSTVNSGTTFGFTLKKGEYH